MSQIEWDESLDINNTEINDQHKRWIDIYNRLDSVMLADDLVSETRITEKTLLLMLDYTRYHFTFEEELLSKMGYPGIVGHVRLHNAFNDRIYQSYRDVCAGRIVLNAELLKMIKTWLLNHILVEDKKYSMFASDHKQQAGA